MNLLSKQLLLRKLKELTVEYREITKYMAKLEAFAKLSCEVEENHTNTIKVIHQYLTDMKDHLETILEPTGNLTKFLERVVEFCKQSIDKIEEELNKLTPIATKYEVVIQDIEGLREIINSISFVNPTSAFSAITQNQARLIKTLPELQVLSMRRYLDRFENAFTDSVMLAKNIVENNKCITYLKAMVKKAEEKAKVIEREANEDMALLRVNTKRQMAVMETRIEKLMKKEQVDMLEIVELKKELDTVKGESESVIQNISKNIKDIASYHQMHAQLLASENSVVRNGVKEDEEKAGVFIDFMKTFGLDLRQALHNLINQLKDTKESIEEQSQSFQALTHNVKVVDQQERTIIKQEIENFKRSLINVRSLLASEDEAIKETVVELKAYIDQLSRSSNKIAQTFEKQVNRFIELNKINEKKLRGLA